MTRKDRKRHSREFKLEAVRRSYDSGKPVTEVARELDVSVHHLYRWRDEVSKAGDAVFPGHGRRVSSKGELEALRKENKRLREERDILKKSLIFFAKDHEINTGSSGNTEASLA